MTETIRFTLDGKTVEARPGETIWQVAKRLGTVIPHLCHRDAPGYRPDGNCRACMVEITGERVLAPSCLRTPSDGMVVTTDSRRAVTARRMVLELLLADQPAQAAAHDPDSLFWRWAAAAGLGESRFPARTPPVPDRSHPAMAVHLDACIHCSLCVRACREVQVNDVIGMAHRGARSTIVFDFQDPMGDSTCVACGECVQACPTGALLPATRVDAQGVATLPPDRTVDSLCPYCGVGCQLTWEILNDKIVSVAGRDGPANHSRLCVKGRFGFDYVSHPQRLLRPLIRKQRVTKDPDRPVDPADPSSHFREATWEEALERAAAGFRNIRDGAGSAALAGFGSAKGSNEEAYLFQKLVRTGFGTNNVDHCTRLCHASSVAALMEGIGSAAVTAPFAAALEADVIIVIGARPEQNHPVAATFIKNAARNGAALIVMDPRRQALARYAEHMVQFRPGTDVALLSAMIHTIIEEGLADRQYVEGFTEGFAELAARVRAFAPEAVSAICGVDAATIRTIARRYATAERAIVFWGMGISQHVHGTDNARCLIALALITGQIGRPGTGLHPLRGQNNVQGASDAGLIPMVFPDYRSVEDAGVRAAYEAFWGTALDPKHGLTVVEIMTAARQGTIKGLYVMGENPAMSDPDLAHAREALATLDHLVVQDIFLTETAGFADVVLPASAFPEKSGTFTNTNREVQLARTALPLPGDCRQDLWIIQAMARNLGLDWRYGGPEDVFAEMRRMMPSLAGISWERLEREGAVTYPCDAEDEPGREILFGEGFPTASGRGRLVPVDLVPPHELPDETYPLILSTGRLLEHWHTGAMSRRAAVLDALEPDAVASLHPRELAKLGLAAGARATVSTRRGGVDVTLRADADVPEGMVFMPFCFTEAPANLLTHPQLDPIGKIPEFKVSAARIDAAGER